MDNISSGNLRKQFDAFGKPIEVVKFSDILWLHRYAKNDSVPPLESNYGKEYSFPDFLDNYQFIDAEEDLTEFHRVVKYINYNQLVANYGYKTLNDYVNSLKKVTSDKQIRDYPDKKRFFYKDTLATATVNYKAAQGANKYIITIHLLKQHKDWQCSRIDYKIE